MNEEIDSLVINENWDLVELHVGKRALQKSAYKLKEEYGGKKRTRLDLW